MKRVCVLLWALLLWGYAGAVSPGVENVAAYLSSLQGKKVGIVANQTSVVQVAPGKYQHSVDFLQGQGIDVVRIFCPEHGFRGDADAGELVGDYQDEKTGLPVISLYGKKKKPLPADLKGIEVVLFDMQDVGVRFYTYLSTLHYVMEACAEQAIPVVVLDRPNPNAFYVDGPVLKEAYRSFVGMHPVPIVYGMTIGEYAQMINGEGWLAGGRRCHLTVVPCREWNREMEIELPRKPSPNLPDKVSVLLYPSVCLFEGTVVNEGRGTQTPFQVFGHPQLKNMPYRYTPVSIPGMSKSPKCQGKLCYGMDLRGEYKQIRKEPRLHLGWLISAYRNYTGQASFFTSFFDRLAGDDRLRKEIVAGKTEAEIRAGWQEELRAFETIRVKYLIY